MKKTFTLSLILAIACANGAFAVVDCSISPNNCSQCTQQLDNCDTSGTVSFTSADAATNPDNPCYSWCS